MISRYLHALVIPILYASAGLAVGYQIGLYSPLRQEWSIHSLMAMLLTIGIYAIAIYVWYHLGLEERQCREHR
jgi:hypothetical protein